LCGRVPARRTRRVPARRTRRVGGWKAATKVRKRMRINAAEAAANRPSAERAGYVVVSSVPGRKEVKE